MPLEIAFLFPVTQYSMTTMPAVCDSTLSITVVDPDTDAVIRRITRRAPPTADDIDFSPDMLTDDNEAPVVVETNTYSGHQMTEIDVRFSEPMNEDSVKRGFIVDANGPHRQFVPGKVELLEGNTLAVYRPDEPFLLGQPYSLLLFGMTDLAGNFLESESIAFTPFDTSSLSRLSDVPALLSQLRKCSGQSGCTTSARDVATIGDTLFVANGQLVTQQYSDPAPPARLVVVDVSNADQPKGIGSNPTATNPRALAAVPNASFTLPNQTPFAGDLLLVAGGGPVPAGDLDGKLELYDVSSCTRNGGAIGNCLDPSLNVFLGSRTLSTAGGASPLPGVPPESGIPLQVAVLHQLGATASGDNIVAYVVTAGLGLEAVDVTRMTDATVFAPDGLVRGDFLDVAVLKNLVLAIEQPQPGVFDLSFFTAQLSRDDRVALPVSAARVAVLENFVVDVDRDGNLGTAEDQDGDPTTARDELFDLALVGSGPETDGCMGTSPCGELLVVDVSHFTDLQHPQAPNLGIIARIPLPGPAFSIQVDALAKLAFVEVRGKGLAIVDLSSLTAAIQSGTPAPSFVDNNQDGVDDRVLKIVPKNDIFGGEVRVDLKRGVAYVNGATSGVELVQVANNCGALSVDQKTETEELPDGNPADALQKEKDRLIPLVENVAQGLINLGLGAGDFYLLEQGSGSCFWGDSGTLAQRCTRTGFQAGKSDHDIEVYVPTALVEQAQKQVLDPIQKAVVTADPPLDLNFFAVSRQAFESAELLNGTPVASTGAGSDPTGDLALARQQLILLWILAGEYVTVPGFPSLTSGPPLTEGSDSILEKLRTTPVIPGETTGFSKLEGFERGLLEEFNFYKTGALMRIRGACESGERAFSVPDAQSGEVDPTDPGRNFDEAEPPGRECDEQLHKVAKPAIRAALGKLVLSDEGAQLLFDLARGYRTEKVCLAPATADELRTPPTTASAYQPKLCGGFEEFIASAGIESVRRNLGIFDASEVADLFSFYCMKVGVANCTDANGDHFDGRLIDTDNQANLFIAKAFGFIEAVKSRYRSSIQHGRQRSADHRPDRSEDRRPVPLPRCNHAGLRRQGRPHRSEPAQRPARVQPQDC